MTHIIHISDTHFGVTEDFAFGEAVVLPRVRAVVDAINALEFEPDIVIHTGDVVDRPGVEAYERAAMELGRLRAPVYYACGNHDEGEMILKYLAMGDRKPLGEGITNLAYSIETAERRLFVLDGCDTGRRDGSGELSDSQFDAFVAAVRIDERPFLVFVHFPPLPVGCPWVDRKMLLAGGEKLHEFLSQEARGRVGGVFFGHIHAGVEVRRDGVCYRGVGSAVCRIRTGPVDEGAILEPDAPVCFNHIALSENRTVIRELSLCAS